MKSRKDKNPEYLHEEIISKYDLDKTICFKLINLLDLITLSVDIYNKDKNRFTFDYYQNIEDKFSENLIGRSQILRTSSLNNKILIPLSKISLIGCSYKEIQYLKEISPLVDEKSVFLVYNLDQFEKNQPPQSYNLKEDFSKARENLIISVSPYFSDTKLNSFLNNLLKIAPEFGGIITLKFGPNGLSRRLGEKELSYPIQIGSDRHILLLNAIKGPKKSKEIKFKGKKTHSMIKKDVNKAIQSFLKLSINEDFIVNYNRTGYRVNEKLFKIILT